MFTTDPTETAWQLQPRKDSGFEHIGNAADRVVEEVQRRRRKAIKNGEIEDDSHIAQRARAMKMRKWLEDEGVSADVAQAHKARRSE